MANRTSSNVKGDIGELQVVTMLLDHGMVVNNLTGSDAGWDLHAMLPTLPMVGAENMDPKVSWTMSGKTCHIQVKNAKKSALKLGTVREWVYSNSPTFIFVKRDEKWRYASLDELKKWIDQFGREPNDAKINHTQIKRKKHAVNPLETIPYDPQYFSASAHLWAYFPNMTKGGSFEWLTNLMMTDKSRESVELEEFAVNVAFGLWFVDKPSRDEIVNSSGPQVEDLRRLLTETGIFFTDDLDNGQEYAWTQIGNRVDEVISEKHGWRDPLESASRYTAATDHAQRLEDAIAMVRSVVELLRYVPGAAAN